MTNLDHVVAALSHVLRDAADIQQVFDLFFREVICKLFENILNELSMPEWSRSCASIHRDGDKYAIDGNECAGTTHSSAAVHKDRSSGLKRDPLWIRSSSMSKIM